MIETPLAMNVQTNWKIFEQILGSMGDVAKMTTLEVCQKLYESTAMHYSLKYHDERTMSRRRHPSPG